MSGLDSFKSLARAMFLGFRRDRRALFFTVIFPLMFLVIFAGLLGNRGASKGNVAEIGNVTVLDQAMAADPSLSKFLKITKYTDQKKALDKVKKGDVDAAVSLQGNAVTVYTSQADQVKSSTAVSVIDSIVQTANVAASGKAPAYTMARPQTVDDKSLKAIQFFTPSLLGWALASAGIFGAAQTLVQWRVSGLLRRLRLSPAPIPSVLGARVAVSLAVALGQMAIFVGVAGSFFGLKLSHSWWMSVPLMASGVLAFLSIGMVIGAWAKTIDSAQTITQMIILPMAFLGGSFFPLDITPRWLQIVSYIFPLRWLNEGMLNVMARGLGPASALPQMLVLLGIAVVFSLVGLRLFRWDDA